MPIMDRIQLITGVNEMNHSVMTILMTAFDVHEKLFQEYSKKQIMNGFAQKPVSLQTLVQQVSSNCILAIYKKYMLPRDGNHKNIYKL
jgi:DNA-binding NtrC family response regulator